MITSLVGTRWEFTRSWRMTPATSFAIDFDEADWRDDACGLLAHVKNWGACCLEISMIWPGGTCMDFFRQ